MYPTLLRAFCLCLLVWSIGVNESAAQVAIAPTSTAPAASAMLEVISTAKGLLAPRVTSAQRQAIPAPANGLLVFQTNNGADADTVAGYWYYDALQTKWVPLQGTDGWTILGNAGTNSNFHYVGTSDARSFRVVTQNVERMRIQDATGFGRIGINSALPPQEALEINGALRIQGTTALNNEGTMRWNAALSSHEGNITGTPTGWYELENAFQQRVSQPFTVTGTGCLPNWYQIGTVGATTVSSTIETPYSRFWEDGRKQYLWLASDLAAIGLCPNQNITGVRFNATGTGGALNNVEIKMKNTATAAMTNFDYAGLQFCGAYLNHPAILAGFANNTWTYSTPFQWNGSSNVILEFCFNNYEWSGNVAVSAELTPFNSGYGMYCDACGGTGTVPCTPTIPPNPGSAVGPCGGTGAACDQNCCGYSMTPGCNLTSTSNLVTCDGTFTYNGAQGAFPRRPVVQFNAFATGTGTITANANYLYSTQAVLVGDAAWAATVNYPDGTSFKGPGTIHARNSVWARNLILNDHVLDNYYDGRVRPEDYDAARGYRRYAIDEMANYVERERHLPTVGGREEWTQEGLFSVDKLTNQLWVTVEDQALYIKELKERMDLLQQFLLRKRLEQFVNGR